MSLKKNKLTKVVVAFLSITILFTGMLMLVGCGEKTGTEKKNDVLITVNGVDITAAQVDSLAAYQLLLYGMDYNSADPAIKSSLRSMVLSYLLEDTLIRDYLKSKDVTIITEEVQKNIDAQLEIAHQSFDQTKLDENGITEDTLLFVIESMYVSQAYQAQVNKENAVTEETILEYYEKHKPEFSMPASISISVIKMGDASHSDEARAEIEEVRQLILDGEDFATLAAEYSEDEASKYNGGAYGQVSQAMGSEFEFVAFSLEEGQISEVVEISDGFYIVLATSDIIPGQERPLEEVKSDITLILQGEQYTKAIEKLRADATIEYDKDRVTYDEATDSYSIKTTTEAAISK